jgi:hypothetical protein
VCEELFRFAPSRRKNEVSLLEPLPYTARKSRPMAFAVAAVVLIGIVLLWWALRFYPEKRAAEHFFDALVAGDTATAYKLWKPTPSYKMQDFLADWGPTGYFGPVKSYQIAGAASPHGATNAVEVAVRISPFAPMPDANDKDKSQKTRLVGIWIVTRDKSFSFPP